MVNQIDYENLLSDAERNKLYEEIKGLDIGMICILPDYSALDVKSFNLENMSFVAADVPCKEGEILELHFSYLDKKYLIRGPAESIQTHSFCLNEHSDCYQIQRRDNFRVSIFGPTHVKLLVETHSNIPCNVEVDVINLSLGGCLVEAAAAIPHVKVGDTFQGLMSATGFKGFPLKAQVRRVQAQGRGQVIGLQFIDLKGHYLGFLNKIVLKVSREAAARTQG